MVQSIYPENFARENYRVDTYCEMAMEAYSEATQWHNEIKKVEYAGEAVDECCSLNKCVISTIIFSAMSVEAFLNDYAATCLGDDDFYENFDRLSALGKFELIARFVLHSEVDKGKSYYAYFKSLFKARDSYVHSKSHLAKNVGMTKEEWEDFHNNFSEWNPEEQLLDRMEIENEMRAARDALKAVYEITRYFDTFDSTAYAFQRVFSPSSMHYGPKKEVEYKKLVFSMLGIKVSEIS